ncbi:hypothetical protein SASPL_103884 [Salvia splendens]|uniref:Uncharacterized protein n=1 Tax=Salvia splendens TaxID=180675 RepID=A0A8X8YIW7_SALSN|nr:hypothetical protein SASPL_103884 [Salvia splendens]
MKSPSQHHHAAAAPPPPQPETPLLHLVAAAALFEADLMPPPPPREPVVALDDEFERMSLRNYHQSPVIPYRRNHQKKSASSSSSSKNRHSSNKTSISPSPLKQPAFAAPPAPTVRLLNYFDSENRGRSTNAAAVEAGAYSFGKSISQEERSDTYSLQKSEFASSSAWKKYDWFNKSSPSEDTDTFQKSPFYKKFEFVSKSKQDYFPSDSEFNVKIEVADDASNPKQHHSNKSAYDNSKIEKLSMVVAEAAAAADAPNPTLHHLKKSELPSQANSNDKMKSKVVEDSHLPPKKKPSFAFASPINPKIPLLKPKLEQPDAAEKKSNPAESDAAKIKIEPKEVKEEVQNPKKDADLTGNDGEATRVWNLRPRIPKGKGKAVTQTQTKSGGASKSGVEKMAKLSISISLTKEEIEEDIFALTGAKPARRPKKRPRNVQKQLDIVFPGLWLMSISKDTYKVSEKK